jgi:hypothetical protein
MARIGKLVHTSPLGRCKHRTIALATVSAGCLKRSGVWMLIRFPPDSR